MDEEIAARWAIRLELGPLDIDEQRELDSWLQADNVRAGILLRAEATLAYVSRARALDDGENSETEYGSPSAWSRRRILLAAGSVAGVAMVGTSAFVASRPATIDLKTALGEIRRVPLADGSVASINTSSDLSVSIAEASRHVVLREGEAWFQVARDKARPFVVEAGKVRVQAVGTAFSVRLDGNGAGIFVTEGVVEVWVAGASVPRQRLSAGMQAYVSEKAAAISRRETPGEVERKLSWRTGELTLDGESLEYAVNEINRYNELKVIVDTENLRREPMVGFFRIDQPAEFSEAVAAALNARITTSSGEIHISR